jgi:hypothetical protein
LPTSARPVQDDHDTIIVLTEQSKQLATLLTRMDTRQTLVESDIQLLKGKLLQFHAIAASCSVLVPVLMRLWLK